jgi:hypothetical protein
MNSFSEKDFLKKKKYQLKIILKSFLKKSLSTSMKHSTPTTNQGKSLGSPKLYQPTQRRPYNNTVSSEFPKTEVL